MTSYRLASLLEYAFADSVAARKELLEDPSFVRHAGEDLVAELSEKQLLHTEDLEASTLLQEEILKTIYAGAEPFRCFRDLLPVVRSKAYLARVITSSPVGYAEEYDEATEIQEQTTEFSKLQITPKYVATSVGISNALIEDGLFDLVQLEIEKIGIRLENKLNRDCLLALLQNADSTNDVDPDTSAFGVSHLADAMGNIKSDNFLPTDFVLLPFAEAQLIKDSPLLYANYAGTDVTLREGKIPKILGMKPWTCSVSTGDTTYYWDRTDGANHFMGLVLDAKNAAIITMVRDITIKNYEHILADLQKIVGTMRYGVGVIQSSAIARILTNTPP